MDLRRSVPVFLTGVIIFLVGCSEPAPPSTPSGKGGWLSGTTPEKMDTIAKHFRGNDLVMMEVDWRLKELAKAGLRENWPNAEYQIEKMALSMNLGRERRPKREKSYLWFFSAAFPPIQEAIKNKNRQQFEDRFPAFVQHCNDCHEMEKVPHFLVELPSVFVEASETESLE